MFLFFERTWARLKIWFHKYWVLTYTVPLLLVTFLISKFLVNSGSTSSSNLTPPSLASSTDFSFANLSMAIGGLAVLAVAFRQHKDSKFQAEVVDSPKVVRMCGDNKLGGIRFDWNESLFNVGSLLNLDKCLAFALFPVSLITSLDGYLLKDGQYYRLKFESRRFLVEQLRQAGASSGEQVQVEMSEVQTWAYSTLESEGNSFVAVRQLPAKKVNYPGAYYCVTFMTLSGVRYVLEEDHAYKMRLFRLDQKRPKWGRDFLAWLN